MEKTTERDIQIRAAKAYPILTEIAPENDIKNAQFLAYLKGATEQYEIDINKARDWLMSHYREYFALRKPIKQFENDFINAMTMEE